MAKDKFSPLDGSDVRMWPQPTKVNPTVGLSKDDQSRRTLCTQRRDRNVHCCTGWRQPFKIESRPQARKIGHHCAWRWYLYSKVDAATIREREVDTTTTGGRQTREVQVGIASRYSDEQGSTGTRSASRAVSIQRQLRVDEQTRWTSEEGDRAKKPRIFETTIQYRYRFEMKIYRIFAYIS